MGVSQPVVVHLELKDPVDVGQLELDAVFTSCSETQGCWTSLTFGQKAFRDQQTFSLEKGSDKRVDSHKLQLNIVAVKRDPAAPGQHFNDDVVLLPGNTHQNPTEKRPGGGANRGSSQAHHQVCNSVCRGGRGLSDAMMAHGSHSEDPRLLEHPAGQSHSQLHVPRLLMSGGGSHTGS